MDRLGVDWRQRQPGAELELNPLRVLSVGHGRDHLALVHVYWRRQRAGLGGYNVPSSWRSLQVEGLKRRSVVGLVTMKRRRLDMQQVDPCRLGLDRHHQRPGLVMVCCGHVELQHVAVLTNVVVDKRRSDVAGLERQTGQDWWQLLQRRTDSSSALSQLQRDSHGNSFRQQLAVLLAPTAGVSVAVRQQQLLDTPDLPATSAVQYNTRLLTDQPARVDPALIREVENLNFSWLTQSRMRDDQFFYLCSTSQEFIMVTEMKIILKT